MSVKGSMKMVREAKLARFELKSLKRSLGRDGYRWSATIYFDGKKAGTVENDGWGGPDIIHFNDRNVRNKAIFIAERDLDREGWNGETALSIWLSQLADAFETVNKMKRKAKRNTVFVSSEFTQDQYGWLKTLDKTQVFNWVKKQESEGVQITVLNDMLAIL